MKSNHKWAGVAVGMLGLVLAQGVSALDITIVDQLAGGANFNGGPSGQGNEDNATEPGTIANQRWDYEAMFLTGNKLGVVAGFDMKSGKADTYVTPQGDIFLRVGSQVDAKFINNANDPVAFDYVIHFPQVPPPPGEPFSGSDYWTSGSIQYQVYGKAQVNLVPTGNAGITGGNALLSDWLWQSSPKTGETPIYSTADAGVPMALYADDQTAAQVAAATGIAGLLGDASKNSHDILSGILLDWGKLGISGADVYFYTTMGCGNDLLEGKVYVPDGGLTVTLLGLGLAGLGFVARRRS